ncbi:MAG TPA: glycoside hydrolase family 28 protein [Terriglobia bacterium]|nr:glycoside hydrolase family 28 protein [Terriglobia bacterium]
MKRPDLSRRDFLRTAAALPLIALQLPASDPWDDTRAILARIKEPVFPNRDFDVQRYASINEAIVACNRAGGGRVVVPEGTRTTQPLRLLSHVNLYLSAGAILKFTTDPGQYLPVVFTRWEGTELMNYSPFIYAYEQEDIAISGPGTLDGQASASEWWNWTRNAAPARRRLMDLGASGASVSERVFGEGSFLRPNFIQPYRCRNVFIEGITIRNSPMWEIHPVLCSNVIVRGVSIDSHGPNNDGCNPESCRDVLIENCSFDTGDDCIALKSGRNNDGRRVGVPVENVIVRDCIMKDGHGGVTIGSEISGGARNVFAERCRMDSPQLDRALRLKTNSVRGGVIERIHAGRYDWAGTGSRYRCRFLLRRKRCRAVSTRRAQYRSSKRDQPEKQLWPAASRLSPRSRLRYPSSRLHFRQCGTCRHHGERSAHSLRECEDQRQSSQPECYSMKLWR